MLQTHKSASFQTRHFLRFLLWLGGCLLLQAMGFVFLLMFAPVWTSLQVHEILGIVVSVLVLLHLFINRWFWKELVKPFKNLKTFKGLKTFKNPKTFRNPKISAVVENIDHWEIEGTQRKNNILSTLDNSNTCNGERGQIARLKVLFSYKLWVRALGQGVLWLLTYGIGLFMMADLALVICSGVFSSQYLFPNARLSATWFENTDWRQIHTVSAYYLLVGIGVHLGVHLHELWAFLPKYLKTAVQVMSVIVAWHGVQVWMEGDYWNILTGQLSFGFWDFDSSAVWFFTDKIAMIAVTAWCFYGLQCAAWKTLRL